MSEPAQLKAVYPVLPARDVEEAVRFYVDRLGFRLAFGDPSGGDGYAGVRRDTVEVHLQLQFEKDFKAGTAGVASLRFKVNDVDALYEEYKRSVDFGPRTQLRETPWGTREFTFSDLNGNSLTFMRIL